MAVCLSSRSLMHSGSLNLRHGELENGPVVVASISGRGSAGSFKENSCWDSSSLGLRQRGQPGKRFALQVISKGGSDQSLSTSKGINSSNSPQIQLLQRSPSAIEWSEMMESKSTSSFNVKESGIQPLHTQDGDDNAGEGNNKMFKEDHPCLGETPTTFMRPLAERWREIQGERKWKGLLTPQMDSVLRTEIVKCGEFAQANYDAFDYEPTSKYCGSSRFNKKKLLENVGLQNRGYEVTKFLYAMADVNVPKFFRHSSIVADDKNEDETWSRHSNWMGFIAVATDEEEIRRLGRRDIMVSWRGTVMALEWMENLRDILAPTSPGHRGGRVVDGCNRKVKVERGFLSLYNSKDATTKYNKNSAAEQVKMEIQRLVELYSDEELSITITGHSLGGALATLSAYDIANSNCTQRPQVNLQKQTCHNNEAAGHDESDASSRLDNKMSIPITAFTFASPRVGNDAFRDRLLELGVHVLRIENKFDIVPKVPGLFVNERAFTMFGGLEHLVSPWLDRIPWTYTHVGEEVKLDQTKSASLKTKRDYGNSHNLELYLHLLSIYQGPKLPYKDLTVLDRDIALVNKSCNQLKDKFRVPACWYQSKNKGMEQDNGRWVLPDRADDDVPSSDAPDDWV
jgi:hypothetical protein